MLDLCKLAQYSISSLSLSLFHAVQISTHVRRKLAHSDQSPAEVLTFPRGTPRAVLRRVERENGRGEERGEWKRRDRKGWVKQRARRSERAEGTGRKYDISHCAERVGLVYPRLHTKSRIAPERCSKPVFSSIPIGATEAK